MTLTLRIDNFDTLDDGGPTRLTLNHGGASVGRRTSMDWVLPDPAKHISGHHFDVRFTDGAYWLHDVSTNGTFIQGSHHRLGGPVRLQGGERLIVGHYVIVVDVGASAARGADPQAGLVDVWAGGQDDGDPWDLGAEPLQPVNPLPSFRADQHHQNDPARDFVPLHRPGSDMPSPNAGAMPLQQPTPAARFDTAVQPPRHGKVPPVPMPTPSPPRHSPSAHPPASPASMDGPNAQDIMAAFCKGADLPPEAVQDVDPIVLAETLGKSVKVAVDQIMQMLEDRANVKQFTRGGERTMRSATGNNPMKFLLDRDQAFAALFLQPREGFMTGPDGFENALDDLRRHQMAVFAALQPALADVLEGLSPEEIEQRDATSGNLLGGSKRGKSWNAYVERWDQKASVGDHGMLDVFLKAFAKAYAEAAKKSD